MAKTKKAVLPALMGVGRPTDNGFIPVTYLDGSTPLVVYVGGIHFSDVSSSAEKENNDVDPDVAAHALATVEEIVECWAEYRDGIIKDHLDNKSTALKSGR
jgi:hypothetical protein